MRAANGGLFGFIAAGALAALIAGPKTVAAIACAAVGGFALGAQLFAGGRVTFDVDPANDGQAPES